jgi:hypothetical protein
VQVVLPGEDADQFAELEAQLVKDFVPVGMAEAAMVHDLAVLTWKKLRVDRVEQAVMTQMVTMPLTEGMLEKAFGPEFRRTAMPWLVPVTPVDESDYKESIQLVSQAQGMRNALPLGTSAQDAQRKWPELCAALLEWDEDYDEGLDKLLADEAEGFDLHEVLWELIEQNQTVGWLWENREQVAAAIRRAHDSKLLDYMRGGNTVTQRAHDDLGRAFYRTLSELRRQQDWRIRRSAIAVDDVSPKSPAMA